jgi:erythromycin esterase
VRIHLHLPRALAGACAASLIAVAAAAQSLPNPGFEQVRDSAGVPVPAGWRTGGGDYELRVDTAQRLEGRASLRSRLVGADSVAAAQRRFGVAMQGMPPGAAAGRTLRLTGWIRTENVARGYAGLWVRVDGAGRTLALDNMLARGPSGTTPWTRYVVEVPVDSSAAGIALGVLHPGSGTAWFDSLAVEVVGPALPRRATAFTPPPRPAEDFTRLLSDRELALPPDPGEPAENPVWRGWVRTNARPVRSLGAADTDDLRFLRPLLMGKRIVQLGESGHGVSEFSRAKVRLIRYLHEELGYDVIAFESGLFECDRAGRAAARLDAVQMMRDCIFVVWHAEEVLPLFEYIRETQRTPRPLILTGFDVQRSSDAVRARPAFLERVVAAAGDAAYARRVRETDSTFIAGGVALARSDRDRVVAFYDSLAAWLRPREASLAAAFRDDPAAPALARQAALSAAIHARQLAATGRERIEIRDRGMADNLNFVLDELHPGKKVLVWAHNSHIQHRGYGGTFPAPDAAALARATRTMGTHVAERRRREVYTIGLFMYRGSGANNARVPIQVSPAARGTLESILHGAPWRYSFVDLSRVDLRPGTEWMFREITAKAWGVYPDRIVPRREYDGILFIDTTWPPQYLPDPRAGPGDPPV